MHTDCLFCKIIAGTVPGHIVWEDEAHIAFLTPFPNTPGFTVLVTREHQPSKVTALPLERYLKLMEAARTLATIIDERLGTKRTALVAEGMGIDHAHVKLIPLHGIPDGPWKPITSGTPDFHLSYRGYLTTNDGPRMPDETLRAVAEALRTAPTTKS